MKSKSPSFTLLGHDPDVTVHNSSETFVFFYQLEDTAVMANYKNKIKVKVGIYVIDYPNASSNMNLWKSNESRTRFHVDCELWSLTGQRKISSIHVWIYLSFNNQLICASVTSIAMTIRWVNQRTMEALISHWTALKKARPNGCKVLALK